MAGFIPTSFFLAYAIMSIPAGILIDKYGEKPVLFTWFPYAIYRNRLVCMFPVYLTSAIAKIQFMPLNTIESLVFLL